MEARHSIQDYYGDSQEARILEYVLKSKSLNSLYPNEVFCRYLSRQEETKKEETRSVQIGDRRSELPALSFPPSFPLSPFPSLLYTFSRLPRQHGVHSGSIAVSKRISRLPEISLAAPKSP